MADNKKNFINPKTKSQTANWFKNAAKSLGYAGIDHLEKTMPTTMETININKEFATNVAANVKKLKNTNKAGGIEAQLNGKALKVWKDSQDIKRNALEDLKSGKFYNKERQAKFADEFGLDGFNEDDFTFEVSDDFDEGMIDTDGDGEPEVVVPSVKITTNINKNNPMVQAVDRQTRMLAMSEDAAAKRDISIAESQMGLNKKIADVLYGGMETINSNLSVLVNFNNEQMGGYIGASMRYYEESIGYLSNISDVISKMYEERHKKEEYTTDGRINPITSSGAFDLSKYTALVKKQLNNTIDNDMLLGSIKSMITDADGLQAIAQMPLTFIPQFMISKLVPEILTKSMSFLDKSLKAFIPAMLNKIGSWADNTDFELKDQVKAVIGKIFGLKNDGITEIDTSRYEKGAVPFDGITRKSIVEVIPGYLSKILSALSGKEELIYDYDTGKYYTRSDAKKKYDDKVRGSAISSFSSKNEVDSRLDFYGFNDDEKKEMSQHLENFYFNLSKSKKNINLLKDKDISDLLENSKVNGRNISSRQMDRIISIFRSLPRSMQMQMVGSEHYDSRRSQTETLEDFMNSGNTLATSQFNNLFGEDGDYAKNNPLYKSTDMYLNSNSPVATSVSSSIFTPNDAYGKNNLDYLRDIRSILLEGVGVWILSKSGRRSVVDGPSGSGLILPDGTVHGSGSYEFDDNINGVRYRTDLDEHNKTINRYHSYSQETTQLTEAQIAANLERGIRNFGKAGNVNMSREEEIAALQTFAKIRDDNLTNSQDPDNKLKKFLKFFFSAEERDNKVSKFIDELLFKSGKVLTDFVEGVDKTLYNLVFGVKEDKTKDKGSFFDKFTSKIEKSFNAIFDSIKKTFYDPIKEGLVGEKGIITKFQQSEFYKGLKDKGSKAIDYIFGSKDQEGLRSGGLLSGTANELKGMTDSVKLYVTGVVKDKDGNVIKTQDGSIFSEIKNIFGGFKSTMKEFLFGKDGGAKENAKGALTDVGNYFKEGMQSFADAIFGQKVDPKTKELVSNVTVSDIVSKVKERAPKSLASGIVGGGLGAIAGAGGFGILGSLFLGPMSGAVIGTAVGFLSQSDNFKNWLFGDIDEKTNERVGGLISKSTQDFFKKNKGALGGGAAVGAFSSMTGIGILPSFILGGPITGAIVGLGAAMVSRSQVFQDFIFGKMDEKGLRSGGILGKLSGELNNSEDVKRKLGFAGAGATIGAVSGGVLSSFGILGGLAFGPLSGAIVGAGAGIALAANKWKDAIFGKFDKETGKRTEQGILSTLMTAVSVEVLQPAKIKVTEWSYNVQNWFEEKIAEPFLDSLDPIKTEVSRLKDGVVEFAHNILEKLHIPQFFKKIGKDISTGFTKTIQFVGDALTFGVEKVSKAAGWILSSPARLINLVAEKILLPKHMRQGIEAVRKQVIENIKNTKVVQVATTAVTAVKDFTFKAIKGTFSFFKTALLGTLKFVGKAAVGIIASPFVAAGKIIGGTVKGLTGLTKFVGRRLTGGTYDATEQIDAINSGDRGFFRSIGDLVQTYMPGSSLRRGAAFGEDGAFYQNDRVAARKTRAADRAERKAKQEETLRAMRDKLDANQDLARKRGYSRLTDEEKESVRSFKDYNKIVDNSYKSQYGSEYSKMSKMQKETFEENKEKNKAVFNIRDVLSDIGTKITSLLTNGISIKKNKKDNKVTIGPDGKVDDTPHGKDFEESMAENAATEEKEKRENYFTKLLKLLKGNNDETKKHNKLWESIFSKKGLITAAIISFIPSILKLISGLDLSTVVNNIISGVKDIVAEVLGLKDKDGDRTDSNGDIQKNDNMSETVARGATYAATKALNKASTIGSKGLSIANKVTENVTNSARSAKQAFNNTFRQYSRDDISSKIIAGGTGDDLVASYSEFGAKKSFKMQEIADTLGIDKQTASDMMGNVKTASSKTPINDAINNAVKKFCEVSDDFSKKVIQMIDSKLPGFSQKKGKLITKAISNVIKTPSRLLKFSTKITSLLARVAPVLGAVISVGSALYGFVTGGTRSETANLFGVRQEDVDDIMMKTSSIMKGISNIGPAFVVPLVSEISVAFGGPDIMRLIAECIYSHIVGEGSDAATKLKTSQDLFKSDYDEYTLEEQRKKGNFSGEYDAEGNPIFKEGAQIESFDSYNDRTNKTVWAKIKDSGKNFGGSVKTWFNSIGSGYDDQTRKVLGFNNNNTEVRLKDRFAVGMGSLINTLSGGKVDTEEASHFINGSIISITNKAKTFWKDSTDKISAGFEDFKSGIGDGLKFVDNLLGVPLGGEDEDGNPLSLSETIKHDWTSRMSELKDGWVNLKTSFSVGWEGITEIVSERFKEFKELAKKGLNIVDNLIGSEFGFKDKNGNPISLTDGIKNAWSDLKKSVSDISNKDVSDRNSNMSSATGGGQGGPGGIGGPLELFDDAGTITSVYGAQRGDKTHKGVDFDKYDNAPIKSFTDGTVHKVVRGFIPDTGFYGSTDGGGYGNHVQIKDNNGYIHTYAHLNGVHVSKNQKISEGMTLGIQGHTGSSTGSHLHYDVRDLGGTRINPKQYLSSYASGNVYTGSGMMPSSGLGSGITGVVSSLTTALNDVFAPLNEITSQLTSSFNSLLGTSNDMSSESGTGATANPVTGGYAEKQTWKFLKSKGLSDAAVAGIMGNLKAESNFRTNNLENEYEKKFGMTDEQYTDAVNSGAYKNFITDSGGYGLAQWTYSSRKQALLELARQKGVSISDVNMQLEHLWNELGSYGLIKSLQNANSVDTASKIILQKFEKPDGMHDPKTINYRAGLGKGYYDLYAGGGIGGPVSMSDRTNLFGSFANRIRNRSLSGIGHIGGPEISDKVYDYLAKIVDALTSIKDNTYNTTEKIDELKEIESEKSENNTTVIDNSKKQSNSTMYDIASNRKANRQNKAYQTAKLIASGAQ